MRPEDDARFMRLAIALGLRNNGRTWPNPSVGAVIVEPASGRILATGVTAKGGRPHAERIAIAAAGEAARGATIYVSLEPCSHHGRTPPCAEAILEAGLARVVSAIPDPDPRVAGQSHRRLREAGLEVEIGVRHDEAERAHRGHFTRVRLGRPAVQLKLARTADGYAADRPGEPRLMISGEGGQARTHLARAHADAIAVGIETVIADDPRLDVRLPGLADRSPIPVVLDSRLRLPVDGRLALGARQRPTWIVCTESADADAEGRLRDLGLDILRVPSAVDGRLDIASALRTLATRGITRLFCEGGPVLADALAEADCLDEIRIDTGSRALGRPGRPAVGPGLVAAIESTFTPISREQAGDDLIEHYERRPCSPAS